MAALGGQDMFSPYAAMGNTPEINVDPSGLMPSEKFIDYGNKYMAANAYGGESGGIGSASGSRPGFLG